MRVNVKVVEGERERVQAFEGVCIARTNAGLNSSFTVRKISYGEGWNASSRCTARASTSIEVVRRGEVRRAKLYYLRGRRGKSARIAEKMTRDAAGKAAAPAATRSERTVAPRSRADRGRRQQSLTRGTARE